MSDLTICQTNAAKTHCTNGHEFTPANTKTSTRLDGRTRRSCRACGKKRTLKYNKSHPETVAASHRRYLDAHPGSAKAWNKAWRDRNPGNKDRVLAKRFRVPLAVIQSIRDEPCEICGGLEPRNGARISLDHNHTTGALRGGACHSCNVAIGYFKEDPTIMLAAIAYLDHHARLAALEV